MSKESRARRRCNELPVPQGVPKARCHSQPRPRLATRARPCTCRASSDRRRRHRSGDKDRSRRSYTTQSRCRESSTPRDHDNTASRPSASRGRGRRDETVGSAGEALGDADHERLSATAGGRERGRDERHCWCGRGGAPTKRRTGSRFSPAMRHCMARYRISAAGQSRPGRTRGCPSTRDSGRRGLNGLAGLGVASTRLVDPRRDPRPLADDRSAPPS